MLLVQTSASTQKTNDDVNEEWIDDKTRYAYDDGLKFQRLTTPLVKCGDRFVAAIWEDALATIAEGVAASGAQGDEIQAIAGHLAPHMEWTSVQITFSTTQYHASRKLMPSSLSILIPATKLLFSTLGSERVGYIQVSKLVLLANGQTLLMGMNT